MEEQRRTNNTQEPKNNDLKKFWFDNRNQEAGCDCGTKTKQHTENCGIHLHIYFSNN